MIMGVLLLQIADLKMRAAALSQTVAQIIMGGTNHSQPFHKSKQH